MNKIEEKIEHIEEKIVDLDPETDREARKRQPWMPLGGSILAAFILFVIVALFMGWF